MTPERLGTIDAKHDWISQASFLHFISQMSAPSRTLFLRWYTNAPTGTPIERGRAVQGQVGKVARAAAE
eukprot:CAMPEP_0182876348 /NCGR_PEP_ID=MMETSP0034_2-20130328/14096_1 /TAXON_ID=156128 /ORGANISM="Nephroselmis pyriformis, Strain CCMP717" /LENGTH=68 /DNA_ID=CAMNT_0025009133 /DNA_START=106 /DNA_END=312 /DNA_ORIENTATION=+